MDKDAQRVPEEVTTTYVEMRDAAQHSRKASERNLALVEGSDIEVKRTYYRVAASQLWNSAGWSDEEWEAWVSNRNAQFWLIQVCGEIAGLCEVGLGRRGEVEIVTFGLIPRFVGRGLGGAALSLVVERAWSLIGPHESPVQRVWLHTCTQDHERALPNYLAAGFTVFRVEVTTKIVLKELPPAPAWAR